MTIYDIFRDVMSTDNQGEPDHILPSYVTPKLLKELSRDIPKELATAYYHTKECEVDLRKALHYVKGRVLTIHTEFGKVSQKIECVKDFGKLHAKIAETDMVFDEVYFNFKQNSVSLAFDDEWYYQTYEFYYINWEIDFKDYGIFE